MALLAWAGMICILVGSIGFLVAAFRVGVLWGLACLFFPIVSLFFLIVYWRYAKNPFLLQVLGVVLVFIAMSVTGQGLDVVEYRF